MRLSIRALACAAIFVSTTAVFAQVDDPFFVPGKEYITTPNTNALGIPVTGQIVGWDGIGFAFDSAVVSTLELDGIANMGDGHFEELIADTAAMVVSFTALSPAGPIDPAGPTGIPASYWYHESTPFGGSTGVWAEAPMLNVVAPPTQVSGAEMWGPVGDTTHWSTFGDSGGVSVTTASGPYLLGIDLEFAIGATEAINVDALMVLDDFGLTEVFDPGDLMLLSVSANGQFDGGEIWLVGKSAGGTVTASFFEHGGITWDTANDVAGLFGMFPPTEDIDALEALVPEPGVGVMLVTGALLVIRRRR